MVRQRRTLVVNDYSWQRRTQKAALVTKGRVKRGGVRTIYFSTVSRDQILMLLVYAKNEVDNLSPDQMKVLWKIIEEEYP
jgi:hypothetical protein